MKDPDVSLQERREQPDPLEGRRPVPHAIHALIGGMFLFGFVYICWSQVDTPSTWGDGRSRAELSARKTGSSGGAEAKVDGAATYASVCAACHQATGAGLPGVFPPLAGSEWVNGKPATAAAIVLHGIGGSLTVKGQTYSGSMPTFKAQLSDAQVAAVLTHIRSQWGNTGSPIDAAAVAKVREDTKARTTPFGGDSELAALK
jgi:mono/diheme cytochrome c family protein